MTETSTRLSAELTPLLNKHSAENDSDTPDFILANFLLGCLAAFNEATKRREQWYGRNNDSNQDPS
jgi:hypothetical protein